MNCIVNHKSWTGLGNIWEVTVWLSYLYGGYCIGDLEPQGPEEDSRGPGGGEEMVEPLNGGCHGNIMALSGCLVFQQGGERACERECVCVGLCDSHPPEKTCFN